MSDTLYKTHRRQGATVIKLDLFAVILSSISVYAPLLWLLFTKLNLVCDKFGSMGSIAKIEVIDISQLV